jgi:Flp pilus assembly pilin Flp
VKGDFMNALLLSVYCYFKSMFNDEEGQDLIEYALIIAVFVIVAILGLQLLGPQVTAIWEKIGGFLAKGAAS